MWLAQWVTLEGIEQSLRPSLDSPKKLNIWTNFATVISTINQKLNSIISVWNKKPAESWGAAPCRIIEQGNNEIWEPETSKEERYNMWITVKSEKHTQWNRIQLHNGYRIETTKYIEESVWAEWKLDIPKIQKSFFTLE